MEIACIYKPLAECPSREGWPTYSVWDKESPRHFYL